MQIKNFFILSWKKLWIVIVGGFISILLHNLISGLTGTEEAFFFVLVVLVLPAYLLIAVIVSAVDYFRRKKDKDKKMDKEQPKSE